MLHDTRSISVGLVLALSACGSEAAPSTPAPTSITPTASIVATTVAPPTSVAAAELRVGRARVLNGPEAIDPPLRRAVVLVDRGARPATPATEAGALPDTLGADDEINVMIDAPLTPAPAHITLLGETGACEAAVTAAWIVHVTSRAAPLAMFPADHAYEAYVYAETDCAVAPPETTAEATQDVRASHFDFGVLGAAATCESPAMGELPTEVTRVVYFATMIDPEEGWSDAAAAGYHGYHAPDGTWLVRGGSPEITALVLPGGRVVAGESAPCALHAGATTLLYLHTPDRGGRAIAWGTADGTRGSLLPLAE